MDLDLVYLHHGGTFFKLGSRESSTVNMISFESGRRADYIVIYNTFEPLSYLFGLFFLGFLCPRWCPNQVKSRLVAVYHR